MSATKNELPIITPDIDYTQVAPIHQKRTLAFINHFIMRTITYLNNFSQTCESRLLQFEQKIQHIEASLSILESKLISIPGLDDLTINDKQNDEKISVEVSSEVNQMNDPEIQNNLSVDHKNDIKSHITAKDDPRFSKFFKMLQFGVPEQAVKLKMQAEGVDPSILDNPFDVLPGNDLANSEEQSDSDSSSS